LNHGPDGNQFRQRMEICRDLFAAGKAIMKQMNASLPFGCKVNMIAEMMRLASQFQDLAQVFDNKIKFARGFADKIYPLPCLGKVFFRVHKCRYVKQYRRTAAIHYCALPAPRSFF